MESHYEIRDGRDREDLGVGKPKKQICFSVTSIDEYPFDLVDAIFVIVW